MALFITQTVPNINKQLRQPRGFLLCIAIVLEHTFFNFKYHCRLGDSYLQIRTYPRKKYAGPTELADITVYEFLHISFGRLIKFS